MAVGVDIGAATTTKSEEPNCELRWREPRRDYTVINAPKLKKCQRDFERNAKKCMDSAVLDR